MRTYYLICTAAALVLVLVVISGEKAEKENDEAIDTCFKKGGVLVRSAGGSNVCIDRVVVKLP